MLALHGNLYSQSMDLIFRILKVLIIFSVLLYARHYFWLILEEICIWVTVFGGIFVLVFDYVHSNRNIALKYF